MAYTTIEPDHGQLAAPLGEEVECDERTGELRPLFIDREGKFSLTAKPFCDSLKVEIESSPEVAGKIAALLATLSQQKKIND